MFTLGVICPQNLKSQVGQTGTSCTQSRLQVKGYTVERYCLLHVVVQGSGSFRGRSTFLDDLRLRSYGASHLPNFRCLLFFSVTSVQPRGYIAECGDRKAERGAFRQRSFLRLLVGGAGDPQICPNFRLWQMASGASDLNQRCLKTCNSKDGCTFPLNSFAPTSKITPKLFGGPFGAKPIIERALCKSHINGATKVKLYSYIGIGKYLGVCQTFFARVCLGGAGSPNVNLGHFLLSRKLLALES